MVRIDYDFASTYMNLLSIGAALARYIPLSTKLDRSICRDLVILDGPFCIQFFLYLTVLLTYPMHTLTAQKWLSYGNIASLCLVRPADAVYQICISHLHLS